MSSSNTYRLAQSTAITTGNNNNFRNQTYAPMYVGSGRQSEEKMDDKRAGMNALFIAGPVAIHSHLAS